MGRILCIGYDSSQAIAATGWVRAIRHNHMDSMIVSYNDVNRILQNSYLCIDNFLHYLLGKLYGHYLLGKLYG